jgi:trehalose 6-phosphate synthase/phosphatase
MHTSPSLDLKIERLQRHISFKKRLEDRLASLGPKGRPALYIVANRLPVTLYLNEKKTWLAKRSSGGLVSGLSSVHGWPMIWIGWPGVDVPYADQESVRDILFQYNCIPVFLDAEQIDLYYNGYSNNVLWPLFHYISPAEHYDSSREWDAYCDVNLKFARIVAELIQPDDFVWIHDYHLMLTPKLLRELKRDANIGWFLHTPFPSAEFFRMLPQRLELIHGLLACNLVAFHVHDYARHFLSSVAQLTAFKISPYGIDTRNLTGMFLHSATIPIGISPTEFSEAAASCSVSARVESLRDQWGDRKIILGVDRLDYMKGIPHKLRAFDRFLESHPEWTSRCMLIQLAVPSRGEVLEYQRLKREVHELVGSICGKYSTFSSGVPVIYLDRAIGHDELVALYRIADVAIITSLRDGMNLVSYEYVASQAGKCGVLILSEFAGAAQTLAAGCLRVNPWNEQECADTIYEAVTMSAEERMHRHNLCRNYVLTHTAQAWAENFVDCLKDSCAYRDEQHAVLQLPHFFPYDACASSYRSSRRRLLLLDCIDCLVSPRDSKSSIPVTLHKSMIKMSSELNGALRDLSNSADVYVFTSHGSEILDRFLGSLPVNKLAESASLICRAGEMSYRRSYHGHSGNLSAWNACRTDVKNALFYFMDRTPGSYIEECEYSLKWFIDNTQQDFCADQLRELYIQLSAGPLSNAEAVIQFTARYVEVRPHGVSLSDNLEYFMKDAATRYDFLLFVAAPSQADESTYTNLGGARSPRETFIASVGDHADTTRQGWWIPSVTEVEKFLITLSQI